mmetsp:Transcript_18203/g.32038  ORF Transcript_18203/g.32038 Transcript_18203/m.32038 type:complete len:349 (-) Transcript_18203:118-1164(-)
MGESAASDSFTLRNSALTPLLKRSTRETNQKTEESDIDNTEEGTTQKGQYKGSTTTLPPPTKQSNVTTMSQRNPPSPDDSLASVRTCFSTQTSGSSVDEDWPVVKNVQNIYYFFPELRFLFHTFIPNKDQPVPPLVGSIFPPFIDLFNICCAMNDNVKQHFECLKDTSDFNQCVKIMDLCYAIMHFNSRDMIQTEVLFPSKNCDSVVMHGELTEHYSELDLSTTFLENRDRHLKAFVLAQPAWFPDRAKKNKLFKRLKKSFKAFRSAKPEDGNNEEWLVSIDSKTLFHFMKIQIMTATLFQEKIMLVKKQENVIEAQEKVLKSLEAHFRDGLKIFEKKGGVSNKRMRK